MIHKPSKEVGDDVPVTGGFPLPSKLEAPFAEDDDAPQDDLGRQAYWLLKLHAAVLAPRLQNMDLAKMDDEAKRSLIAEIQRVIGLTPLKSHII